MAGEFNILWKVNEHMSVNKLILGDNIEIMKTMESGTVDLVYLAPPFFSNRNYEVIWSDEGDIVLDPFLGGGTTAAVADKINRRWIGIDQSVVATKVSDLGLNNQRPQSNQITSKIINKKSSSHL